MRWLIGAALAMTALFFAVGAVIAREWEAPSAEDAGLQIVFTGANAQGYIMNMEGNDLQQLGGIEPICSSDGTRLYAMNDPGYADSMVNFQALSPDGSRRIFEAEGKESFAIYVSDPRRLNPVRVFEPGYTPSWSPRENIIAYSTRYRIYLVDMDRSIAAPLVKRDFGATFSPVWTPDGNQIAFAAALSSASWSDLYLVNADGSGLHRVGTHEVGLQSPCFLNARPPILDAP